MTGIELQTNRNSNREVSSTLAEITRLFRAIHAKGIRYCHWKSNQHLRASLQGHTDLDLLVDRRDAQGLALVLSSTTFKRASTLAQWSYHGIESYLGFDPDTGAIIHLHLHYQLTLGEPLLKGFRLPWEERLLETRLIDDEGRVYVADPALELLLWIVRAALKLRWRDRIRALRGDPYPGPDMVREWDWLGARVKTGELATLAGELLGEAAASLVLKLPGGPAPGLRELSRIARTTAPPLKEYRTYGWLEARLRRWWRE